MKVITSQIYDFNFGKWYKYNFIKKIFDLSNFPNFKKSLFNNLLNEFQQTALPYVKKVTESHPTLSRLLILVV
jgi:hypothetical protein